MTVTLGINPIGWTNDCMGWLGDLIPLSTLLSEARETGFSGVELGRKYPKQPKKLKSLLDKHDLKLVSGWYSAKLLERDTKEEIAAMQDHLALMKGCGAKVMVFAETTNDIVLNVGAGFSARPKITSAAEWKKLGIRMTEVADYMLGQGVQMAVHHHMGTPIESQQDVDRLMENTGYEVGLLLDTGKADALEIVVDNTFSPVFEGLVGVRRNIPLEPDRLRQRLVPATAAAAPRPN